MKQKTLSNFIFSNRMTCQTHCVKRIQYVSVSLMKPQTLFLTKIIPFTWTCEIIRANIEIDCAWSSWHKTVYNALDITMYSNALVSGPHSSNRTALVTRVRKTRVSFSRCESNTSKLLDSLLKFRPWIQTGEIDP